MKLFYHSKMQSITKINFQENFHFRNINIKNDLKRQGKATISLSDFNNPIFKQPSFFHFYEHHGYEFKTCANILSDIFSQPITIQNPLFNPVFRTESNSNHMKEDIISFKKNYIIPKYFETEKDLTAKQVKKNLIAGQFEQFKERFNNFLYCKLNQSLKYHTNYTNSRLINYETHDIPVNYETYDIPVFSKIYSDLEIYGKVKHEVEKNGFELLNVEEVNVKDSYIIKYKIRV